MKIKSSLLLPLLGTLLATAGPAPAHAIVGGSPVSAASQIAWSTVAVLHSEGSAPCSGSLLSEDVVVTAAHCVWSEENQGATEPGNLRIYFGGRIEKPIRRAWVTDVAILPSYPGPRRRYGADLGDLALVRFEGGLPRGYRPAAILSGGGSLRKNTPVVLAGYGITDPRSGSGAGTLRATTVPIYNPWYGQTEVLLDQRSGKGACGGDSGGPAFVDRGRGLELFGVTSRGYPDKMDDGCVMGSVYTHLPSHLDWIRSTIEFWEQKKTN